MTVRRTCLSVLCAALLGVHAAASLAQTGLTLAGNAHDSSLPITATADRLFVEGSASRAVFEGSAVAVQGDMRLGAERLIVIYDEELGDVKAVAAEGDVSFTNGQERASAEFGEYSVPDGLLVLRGNVVLNQGPNAIEGDMLTLDLDAGTGVFEGNVKTVLHTTSGG